MNHRSMLPLLVLLGSAACSCAMAQTYPTKPVRAVVTFPAGTTVDNVIRIYSPKLAETFGQPFIIENRAGAAGNIGAEAVARTAPDGYTLLVASASIPSSMSLYKDLNFDFVRDFDPIAMLASSPFVLAVHPSLGVKNLQELIQLAKSRPGQLNFASTGTGGTNHLAGELFNSMAGVKIVHVAYKGTGTALPDLVNGSVSMMFASVGQVQAFAKAGRVRILAITSAARSPLAPDLATAGEEGLPGFTATTWFSLMGPTGTPQGVVTRLNEAITRAAQLKDVKDGLFNQGADVVVGNPQQTGAFIRSEVAKFARIVKDSGVKPDQ